MANEYDEVIPKLIAGMHPILRENSVMPRLVNADISSLAARRGATIDVPIPSEATVKPVVASHVQPPPADTTWDTVPVPLDQWHHSDMYLTDKEIMEIVDNGVIPAKFEEHVRAHANFVDTYLLSKYVDVPYYYGSPGTPLFNDKEPRDAAQLRKVLNNNLCPMSPRHVVCDPETEAQALNVPAFANSEWHGDPDAIIQGKLNMRLGFQWWMDQNVEPHTSGTAAGYQVAAGGASAEDTIITIDTGAGSYNVGDIIEFANHSQSYVIVADNGGTIEIRPPLVEAVPGTTAITELGDHVPNLAFHPSAYAYASRPLADVRAGLGVITDRLVDDISGITLRLQVRYGHYEEIWTIDQLFGGEIVRPEMAARFVY